MILSCAAVCRSNTHFKWCLFPSPLLTLPPIYYSVLTTCAYHTLSAFSYVRKAILFILQPGAVHLSFTRQPFVHALDRLGLYTSSTFGSYLFQTSKKDLSCAILYISAWNPRIVLRLRLSH